MITRHEAYPELAKALEMKNLFYKREDLHPYGSHKGRSIPVMIDTYISQGASHFAISSSGNAALAAAFYVEKLNQERPTAEEKVRLDILVGQHISTKKLRKLEQFKNQYINITMHDRPLQTLFAKTKDQSIKGLRQSTDDTALLGYAALAEELLEIPNLQAVFVGASSGTTAQALAEYFDSHTKKVEIHIVQTSSCHPISDAFVDDQLLDEQSIADAIVDHAAIRKDAIVKLLEKNGGSGWVVSNEQILSAQELSRRHAKVDISTNSALSVAGLMQSVYVGKAWSGSVACIICGD
ncbi:MAG: threonine synthase [Patescibacteria group bacterium]|nr:threonine synthase [Patescibacteria group bacterium]